MNAFNACSLRGPFFKFFSLLSLTSSMEGKMRFLPPHREGSAFGLGTVSTHRTGSTNRKTKLDRDNLLIARPGGCPTATGLPLRAVGLLLVPIDREISQSVAIALSRLPPIILRRWTHQIHVIVFLTGQQRFRIHLSGIHQVLLWEEFPLV